MQRQHPLLSPIGLVMTLVVLAIMAIFYWTSGGQMFSPGALASAHADIKDCADCHQPLDSEQATLCMECHTEIRDELDLNEGLHARLKVASQCMACHPDHRGADFDLRTEAIASFDHNLTFFSLEKHARDYDGAPLDCTGCHTGDDYTLDLGACQSCHGSQDRVFMQDHLAVFGDGCLECHDGVDRFSDFNHESTVFPLEGEHVSVACADCHVGGQFSGIPQECAACHEEPAIHAGLFQATCVDCHSPQGWSPAALGGRPFDHLQSSGFSLVKHTTGYNSEVLNCGTCHTRNLESFEVSVCEDCHAAAEPDFIARHTEDFGRSCLECHDGIDSMENFDHASVFVLDGAHQDLDCASCHVDHKFAGTPKDCSGCHAEPDIHAGVFGLNCQNCHSTAAWSPAALTSHNFPLDHGGEGEIPCATCHETTFTRWTCDNCHAPAEMVQKHNEEGIFDIAGQCLECHPTGREDESGGDD